MSNRTLKQSICVSEDINRLSWFEEVLFYRLIVNCDDYGRFDGRASVIRSQLFPLKDSLTAKAVEQALQELANVGLIELYRNESGRLTLRLPSWGTHQRILTRTLRGDSPPDVADCDSYTGEKNILPEDDEKKSLSSGSCCRAQKTEKNISEGKDSAGNAKLADASAESGTNKVNIDKDIIKASENKESEESKGNSNKDKTKNEDFSKKECVEKKFFAGGTSEQKPPAAVTHTEKNKKKRYGQYENVLLTDSEYAKILAMRGGAKAIEFLSEYIEMKGYKANSHYLCIASKNGWVLRAMKERGISLDDETRGEPSFDLDSFFKLAVERGKKEAKHV